MKTKHDVTPANTQFPKIRPELLDRLTIVADMMGGTIPVSLRTPLPEKRTAASFSR